MSSNKKDLNEEKWSGDVKKKWHPKKGTFKKGSAESIANAAAKGHPGDLGGAIHALTFEVNRGGKTLPKAIKSKVTHAEDILRARNKKKKEDVENKNREVSMESILSKKSKIIAEALNEIKEEHKLSDETLHEKALLMIEATVKEEDNKWSWFTSNPKNAKIVEAVIKEGIIEIDEDFSFDELIECAYTSELARLVEKYSSKIGLFENEEECEDEEKEEDEDEDTE